VIIYFFEYLNIKVKRKFNNFTICDDKYYLLPEMVKTPRTE